MTSYFQDAEPRHHQDNQMYIICVRIHQVRSYGNNIAVNVWWRHHVNTHVDVEKCLQQQNDVVDRSLTLDKVTCHDNHLYSDDTQSLRSSY